MAEEVVSQAMGEENGPITRRVAYSGMVEVKNLLFFSEWIRFELTAMWLRASKNDRVLWTTRNCTSHVTRKGELIVLQNQRRTVAFVGKTEKETNKWFHLLSLAMGNDISKFLKLEAALGSGGYAEVFRGVAKQGNLEKYAVKVVNKKQADRGLLAQLRKEVAIHRKLVHKRVVQLVDAYESKTKMYLVLELVDGGMLLDRLITAKKFMEQDARRVMKQLLDGLNYLHSQGVAHRDLKLDNILCTSTKELEVKIADFGLSSLSGTNTKEAESANDGTLRPMRSFVGTPVYMAPEITGSTDYDQSVDMWALGVILYALLCGEFPSTTEDTRKPKEWKVSFPQQSWATVSNEAKDLVTKLLQVDAKHRLSAQDALKHRWFSSNTQFGSDVDLGVNFERLRLEEVEESKRMRKYVNLIRALSRWKNFAHLSPLAVHLEDQHFDSIDEDDDEYPSGNK